MLQNLQDHLQEQRKPLQDHQEHQQEYPQEHQQKYPQEDQQEYLQEHTPIQRISIPKVCKITRFLEVWHPCRPQCLSVGLLVCISTKMSKFQVNVFFFDWLIDR